VVRGTAKVTISGVEKLVQENESVYITATQWHRLENPGKVPLEMIEVQIGTYLGEDDIIVPTMSTASGIDALPGGGIYVPPSPDPPLTVVCTRAISTDVVRQRSHH
jgi:hypothetical protein